MANRRNTRRNRSQRRRTQRKRNQRKYRGGALQDRPWSIFSLPTFTKKSPLSSNSGNTSSSNNNSFFSFTKPPANTLAKNVKAANAAANVAVNAAVKANANAVVAANAAAVTNAVASPFKGTLKRTNASRYLNPNQMPQIHRQNGSRSLIGGTLTRGTGSRNLIGVKSRKNRK